MFSLVPFVLRITITLLYHIQLLPILMSILTITITLACSILYTLYIVYSTFHIRHYMSDISRHKNFTSEKRPKKVEWNEF